MSQHSPALHKVFLSIAVFLLVGYGLFNSRFLLQGPEIVLANVETNSNVIHANNKDFSLEGNVKHSSFITINSRPIQVDEAGNFSEKLLLSNGVSIIDIYARDKFGKETREKIDVVYDGDTSSSPDAYDKIALRVQAQASSTFQSVSTEARDDSSPATTTTLTASSSVMTIAPATGL